MSETNEEGRGAVAGQVERPVRPWGWHAGDGTPAHPAERVEQWPAHNRERMTQPLYDQAALDAAVAAERERILRDVVGLHMAQSVNNQNHPSAWHDGVDAALDAIRRGA